MLEWAPSNQGAANSDAGLAASFRSMWVAPTLAVIVIAGLIAIHPMALLAATPFLLAWLTAPAIAWRISAPQARAEAHLYYGQALFLHRLRARSGRITKPWSPPDDHWLPPDNIQEHPLAAVAHRTSPTNIGLALLANLSAYDFAYISVAQLLERTGNMLRSTGRDGTLSRPLLQLVRYPMPEAAVADVYFHRRQRQSRRPSVDTAARAVDVARSTHRQSAHDRRHSRYFRRISSLAGTRPHMQLAHFQSLLDSARDTPIVTLSAWHACLQQLIVAADALAVGIDQPENIQLAWWSAALRRQCTAMRDELLFLAPWSSWLSSLADSTNLRRLDSIPTLRSLQAIEEHWLAENVAATPQADATQNPSEEMQGVGKMLALGSARAFARIREIEAWPCKQRTSRKWIFSFLFDKATHLMTIGYSVAEQRCDNSYYDLLASEVRLCTFVMIAQGQLPQESWFALGRQLTIAGGDPILLSWSGSMFEYLMPLLVMPTFDNTLLDQTYNSVVQRQIEYGTQRDVPWGISESGFNTFDASLNYQYRAFGVPGLGLKRGLGDDLVVAPYATMLALMIVPELACSNLQRLAAAGFEGQYGLYEAIDYTATRLPRGQTHAVIQSFMAHHQGMGLLSLAYYLLDRPMQRRFESDPLFQATMLLLQEKIPKASAFYSNTTELADMRTGIDEQEMPMRVINRADTRVPEVQLLSNGRYHLMVTNSGRQQQPLERPGDDALARRWHLRQLGLVLLCARLRRGIVLVDDPSTDPGQAG